MDCSLDYIPDQLHKKDKPVISEFFIGEKLFYRCKQGECKRPYDRISLYDISHNRNFSKEDVYKKDDVLYNTIESDPEEKYDTDIVTLEILNLSDKATFQKKIFSQNDPNVCAEIYLKHDPIPCMYPHSVFEVSINGEIINSNNYSRILGKKNKIYKNLRSDIRQELTSIIQSGNVDSIEGINYIDEL